MHRSKSIHMQRPLINKLQLPENSCKPVENILCICQVNHLHKIACWMTLMKLMIFNYFLGLQSDYSKSISSEKELIKDLFDKMFFHWKTRFTPSFAWKVQSFAWKPIYFGEAFVREGLRALIQCFWSR